MKNPAKKPGGWVGLGAGCVFLGLVTGLGAGEGKVDFSGQIRPILSDNCFACHGPDANKRKADLRLDEKGSAFADLGGHFAIVAGEPGRSELVKRLLEKDPAEVMPPPKSGKEVSAEQIELIKRWIEEGADWREHWSFVAPVRQEPPTVKREEWPRNPIDRFILRRLEAEGMEPSEEASKETLIRRATLSLTGLPPTLEEIDAFLADETDGAYERVVDRLLKSERYGEQMARYWLDGARYGDTHGLHLDNERSIWPYRDWVVRAFNENMPYDRFTVEQLAGDLLAEPTLDQLIATGFNRCNVTTSEGGAIPEEFRVRYCVDRVETMSTMWMGLTTGCAVCHDHKFDPILQKEFYEMFAFFNNVDENPMDGNALLPPPVAKLSTPAQEKELKGYDRQIELGNKVLRAGLDAIDYSDPISEEEYEESERRDRVWTEDERLESLLVWERFQGAMEKPDLPDSVRKAVKEAPGKRSEEERKRIRDYYLERVYPVTRPILEPVTERVAEVKRKRNELDKSIPRTLVMKELPKPRESFLLKRGAYDKPGEQVFAGVPAALPPLAEDAPRNRLGLALWLVDSKHPLTARVAVNRFWQHHFGVGIVKTSEDFGSQGEAPIHPKLLDWLATEFIRSGWDIKHIHRLMVTSATYCQRSQITPGLLGKDPENRLLARGPRFRLDAEVVRDNALAVSGLLAEQVGGRGVNPYQPSGIWKAVAYPTSNTAKYQRDSGKALYRRTLYTFWKRTAPPPAMVTFDAPSRESCLVRRERTNTPLQALVLMNDEQFVEAARQLAERIMREGEGEVTERLVYAYRLVSGRRPGERDREVLEAAYAANLTEYRSDPDAAKELIKVGESVPDGSLDESELAAWTMVANLLLNLNETITTY